MNWLRYIGQLLSAAVERADTGNRWLVTRAAHWVDYHWHRNHYDCALYTLHAQRVLVITYALHCILDAIRKPNGPLIFTAIVASALAVVLILLERVTERRLRQASADLERQPDRVPQCVVFYFFVPPSLRIMHVWLVLPVVALIWWNAFLLTQPLIWYWCVVIPSGRPRKPKKEWAPALLPEPTTVCRSFGR